MKEEARIKTRSNKTIWMPQTEGEERFCGDAIKKKRV